MRKLLLVALVTGILLVPSSSLGSGHRIRATDNDTFSPVVKTVEKGTRVVWKNTSDDLHTVTAYGTNWNKDTMLPAGERTAKRFGQRGTYKYVCTEHGHVASNGDCHGMCGKVRVTRAN